MTHSQFITCDLGAAALLEIILQIWEEEILQFSAVPTDQMAVGGGVAVVAIGLSRDGESPDLAFNRQLVQVAVNRSHSDVGEFFSGQLKDLFGIQMVVDIGKYVADQRLLLGHLTPPFESVIILVLIISQFSYLSMLF